MKKVLSIFLVLMMVVCAAFAVAEEGLTRSEVAPSRMVPISGVEDITTVVTPAEPAAAPAAPAAAPAAPAAPAAAPVAGPAAGNNNAGTVETADDVDETTDDVAVAEDNEATEALKEELMAAGAENALQVLSKSETGKEVLADLTEGGYTKVNEIVTLQNSEAAAKAESLTMTLTFTNALTPGEPVMVVFAIPGANGEVEYAAVEGKVDADGNVVVVLDADLLKKLGTEPYVAMPVTK